MTRISLFSFVLLLALPLAAQTNDVPLLDLQSVSLGLRYRMLENDLGSRVQNWSEHHQGLRLRLKLDRTARYSLSAVALNGDSFIASWNPRGVNGRSSNRIFLKQLFVTGKPREGVELQYGGLGIARGESSEITSYDNDGYITGQRLTLATPAFVDELTLTAAYLGDFQKPSVMQRWHRLGEINYGQVLVKKNFGERMTMTAEATDANGERTLRQALAFRPTSKLDLVRLEAYERVSGQTGAGGAITVEKAFGRTRLAASLISIDDRHRPINGDRYGRGRRVSLTSTTAIGDASLQVFLTRALDGDVAMPNRMRIDVHVRYELANALRRFLSH